MSTELGLDPSDPLNLLLHNIVQNEEPSNSNDESDEATSTQDWSKFSSMWSDQPQPALKSYPDLMDFADLSMPMDMDYASMGIEPSSLQLNPSTFNFSFDDQASFNDAYSQFSFQYPPNQETMDFSGSPETFAKERRLSVTSSSSSSGASLSPVPESMPSPATGYSSDNAPPKEESTESNPYANDPAAELAHRVRQTAGVMLAVPMNGFPSGPQVPNSSQGKLPIPRLARHGSASSSNVSSASSAASTPPPSTPPSSSGSPLNLSLNTTSILPNNTSNLPTPTGNIPGTAIPRPKTSHTTIERRYRTNLNARIQSLRMAVPALRVLEDRDAAGGTGKKIKKAIKGGVLVKGTSLGLIESDDGSGSGSVVLDVIDERGFVDGVKVARKCSKANVLGKAVEYIRVLKKREVRLKAEQAGLKTLVAGLVGGPALVREWEKEWRARFGGEEKDEVEGDEVEGDDEDSEDEDGAEDDDETGKKRKRAKVVAAPKKPAAEKEKKRLIPSPVVALAGNDQDGNPMPEKRKRGRPRKVLPSAVTLNPVAPAGGVALPTQDEVMYPPQPIVPAQWTQQQAPQTQPQQFLLAVFALFSFFNSPLTSSSSSSFNHHHAHAGKVLSTAHPPLAYAPEIVSQFYASNLNSTSSPIAPAGWAWKEYVQLFHLLVSLLILASFVGSWLGIGLGLGVKMEKAVARGRSMSARPFKRTKSTSATPTRTPAAGAAGWVKVGEECVLDGDAQSLTYVDQFQIYRAVSIQSPSMSDLATAAMVLSRSSGPLGGLARIKAKALWRAARRQAEKSTSSKISSRLVLEGVDVLDATARLAAVAGSRSKDLLTNGDKVYTPLEVLGCLLVKERVKKHLGKLFIQTVEGQQQLITEHDEEANRIEEAEWRRTIDAARELGGEVEELGKMFERVWKVRDMDTTNDADLGLDITAGAGGEADIDGEIKALLTALVLYRRLFAADEETEIECLSSSTSTLTSMTSTLLSPPPSPSPISQKIGQNSEGKKQGKMMLSLRKALGNRVFEDADCAALAAEEDVEDAGLGLEDARDRVVDMIVDVERRERGVSPSSS